MVMILFYTFVCALVGIFGMRRPGGFFLYFLLSILFTPFISFIILLVFTCLDLINERRHAQRPVA